MSQESRRKGKLVADALAGAWRASPLPPWTLTKAEFEEVTPLLYGSGAAALGWWRVRDSSLKEEPSAHLLHDAYRLMLLQTGVHEQRLEKAFRLLRQAGVDAVLAKGWAAARMYPDRALRPYGDIDLLVPANKLKVAAEVFASPEAKDCSIDLHDCFVELDDRVVDDLFARSTLVSHGEEQIRILGAEDHLALLAVHLLKHGAWRPVWLCDIGAAVESLPANFSWDVCLGGNKKKYKWISTAIGIAHRLLQADISAVPTIARTHEIPTWLLNSVLQQWATPFAINQPPMSHSAPISAYIKRPQGIVKGLRERWPNPILATVSVNGDFNNVPRLPYQIGNWALRMSRFLTSSFRSPMR